MRRREFLLSPLVLLPLHARGEAGYPVVRRGVALRFPRDHGSHPLFRTEWWYITGWLKNASLKDASMAEYGFQITFFRNRPRVAEESPSAFAPRQLLFAHAAIADPRLGRLRHDQRAARAGFGLAEAAEETTDVHIDDWSLALADDRYTGKIVGADFSLDLEMRATQPVLLEGDAGYSRKGPRPEQASYYYSRPALDVSGAIELEGRRMPVTGTAWLDHEWSSEYLAAEAQGWDWIGINFDDGGALMAFRIRDRQGGAYWAGGAHRDARGVVRRFSPGEIRFEPLRRWRSERTGVEYPVAFRVAAGDLAIELEPLMDDQELDSRMTTGTIYWEGAVHVKSGGRAIGRGYLELTGYWKKLDV